MEVRHVLMTDCEDNQTARNQGSSKEFIERTNILLNISSHFEPDKLLSRWIWQKKLTYFGSLIVGMRNANFR